MNLQSPEKQKSFVPPTFTKYGRNNIDLRKMSSTKQFFKTPFPTHKKKISVVTKFYSINHKNASKLKNYPHNPSANVLFLSHERAQPPPHYKFHYDADVKGWRESQKATATSRWNTAKSAVRVGNYFIGIKKKPDTFLNIDVKKLVESTKHHRTVQSARKMADVGVSDESEIESLESLSIGGIERTLTEPTILLKPFVRDKDEPKNGIWGCPVSIRASAERTKQFNWERPKAERKTLVESASKYQAIYLQKLLKEKDKEMKLITNQLIKSNKENVALLKELDGYRGKNYDELYKENITLKEQISRACRENVLLAGQLKKDNNKTLQKLTSANSARSVS